MPGQRIAGAPATLVCLDALRGHAAQIWSVAPSADGRCAVSTGDEHAPRVWSLDSGECERVLTGHRRRVKSVCFSADGHTVASASDDRTARLWQVSDGRCLAALRDHRGQVWGVCFSPDGRWLASASEDRTVRVWEVATGECVALLEGHEAWVWDACFSPDGRLVASAGFDRSVRLWDWCERRCLAVLEGHGGAVMGCAFNVDGTLLASTSLYDRSVRLWDVETGEAIEMLPDQEAAAIAFAPAARVDDAHELLAVGTRHGVVRLWNLRTWTVWKELAGHDPRYWISSLGFDHSGRVLLSSSGDQSVRCWWLPGGLCTQVLAPPRPYAGTRIGGASGLGEVQRANLVELGAIGTLEPV